MKNICISTLLVIVFGTILFTTGCNSNTSGQEGIVTGVIQLDGETDHSGIVVSIYNAGIVPEEISQIREEYPQLAFPIDDKLLFDHREHEALHSVYTDNEGNFSFPKLPYDEYIVAYSKEGWGYNYLFDIELNGGENNITDKISNLYTETELPSYIDGQYVLETGKCYVAKHDVVIGESGHMIMEANSRLLIDTNIKISSHGLISTPEGEDRAYITSYSGIYSDDSPVSNMGDGFYIYSGTNELSNISFSYLLNALQITTDDYSVEFLTFNECVFGLVARAMSDMAIDNCLFANCNDTNAAACYAYDVQGLGASANVFYSNHIAQKHEIVKNAVVSSNAYIENDIGFQNLWESTALFEHNYIVSDGSGVENSGKSNLEILSNEIRTRIGVKTYSTSNWGNTPTLGWTKANNNNFDCEEYSVSCKAVYYFGGEPMPLNFKQNYWNSTSTAFIEDSILDYYDLPPYDTHAGGNLGIIDYSPFRNSSVADAGIQPE